MKRLLAIVFVGWVQLSFAQNSTNTPVKAWTLEDCINYALANNITVKDAELNSKLAEVSYGRSQAAKLPNLMGSASQILSNGSAIDPITSEFRTSQIHSGNLSINSSITLYQGKQLSNQIVQNELLLEQTVLQKDAVKNNIELAVLEAYIRALFAQESINIAQNNLDAAQKEVQRAKVLLEAETIALSDYTEVQSQEATSKYNLINAKTVHKQYLLELKQLLELGPLEELHLAAIDDNLALNNLVIDRESIYSSAVSFLPEVKASELGIASSKQQMDIAQGGYLPTLALTGSLGSGYTSFNNNTWTNQFNDNLNQRIALSLNVPLFDRKQTKSAVQTALINIEKAEIEKQTVEKDVFNKIETAYLNTVSANEQLAAAEQAQTAAEQSYKLAQKKYELGDLSTIDLVISQNTYTNAQQNYLQAKYLSILYYQLLQFYQGNEIKL